MAAKPKSYATPYGFRTIGPEPAWEIERLAYLKHPAGIRERSFHFQEYLKHRWPHLQTNPWTQRILSAFCDEKYCIRRGNVELRFISLTGCATASKTHTVGVFASAWWEMDPDNSAVVLTSTTKKAMAQRVWPVIQEMAMHRLDPRNKAKDPLGNLLNSQHCWQAAKGDDKHSVLCQALQGGNLMEAVENVKGQHTPRRLIVVDECNDTPEAIFAAIPNARKGCQEFIVIFIGNAVSKLDLHGMVCEPKKGWTNINVDDEEWPTGGVKKYQIEPGWCLHFDGAKSPNVLAKQTVYDYLYTYEDWQAGEQAGADYRNSIWFWANDRGFWPSDDLKFTVLTETMLDKYDAYGQLVFYGPVMHLAGFDPGKFSVGGDDAILQFADLGKLENGKLGLQLTDKFSLDAIALSKDPVDYQLASQIMAKCQERGVPPNQFGIDATGTGRGVWAILAHDWNADIHMIEFGGNADDLPASEEDPRPSIQVYDNQVTELWWSVRQAVTAGVMKGMYREAAIEFTGREYELKNRRYRVVDKTECKKRIRRSPDHADAISVLTRVARFHGLIGGATPSQRALTESWLDSAARNHQIFAEDTRYAKEEVEV